MLFKTLLESRLNQQIRNITVMHGGDINQVYLLETPGNRYVLKRNSRDSFPGMFVKEAGGLSILGGSGIRTPRIADVFEEGLEQYLLLEWIREERAGSSMWKRFGEQLAETHGGTAAHFGLDHDNYIGSLVQRNEKRETWAEFFAENRILPLARESRNRGLLDKQLLQDLEKLLHRLPLLVPIEKPALLHGDLWSGNLLCGQGQEPVLIDPAVYYGHREMDIAMTAMFGGFDPLYLEAYNGIFPMETGWEERIALHNLYPNLVHLVLFGSAYLRNISAAVRRFAG